MNIYPVATDFGQIAENEKTYRNRQIRQMIRRLEYTNDVRDSLYDTSPFHTADPSEEEETEETKKPVNYNYKEVATRIQRAKTSASAEQAVLSAKRKVLDLKRKIAAGKCDPEELQAALTHAKRMEMAARKKKHHLELEELVKVTQEADEEQSGMADALREACEDTVSQKEDAIFEKRQEIAADLGEVITEFGEEQLEELEEAMELFENMELIDPHMDKEALEDMKRKHRASENKAIVKADMDYLKVITRHFSQAAVPSGMVFNVQI